MPLMPAGCGQPSGNTNTAEYIRFGDGQRGHLPKDLKVAQAAVNLIVTGSFPFRPVEPPRICGGELGLDRLHHSAAKQFGRDG
jgi:hypothetical protein